LPLFAGTLVAAAGEDGAPGVIVGTCGADDGAFEGTEEPEGPGRTGLPLLADAFVGVVGETVLTPVLAGAIFATPAGPGFVEGFGFVEGDPAVADALEGACAVVEAEGAALVAGIVCVGALDLKAGVTFGPAAVTDPALDCEPFNTAPTFNGLADWETAPMVNRVGAPDRTAILLGGTGIPPLAGFEFVPVPEGAVLADGELALAVAETVAPSAVVTVIFAAWSPGEAAIPANTIDRDCFGSSGSRDCV
jgi:hypothetical protein